MPVNDAISRLAEYHDTIAAAITKAFMGLTDKDTDTVHFKETVNSGYPCIAMVGEKDGRQKRSNLIDKHTGQPQAHCG